MLSISVPCHLTGTFLNIPQSPNYLVYIPFQLYAGTPNRIKHGFISRNSAPSHSRSIFQVLETLSTHGMSGQIHLPYWKSLPPPLPTRKYHGLGKARGITSEKLSPFWWYYSRPKLICSDAGPRTKTSLSLWFGVDRLSMLSLNFLLSAFTEKSDYY